MQKQQATINNPCQRRAQRCQHSRVRHNSPAASIWGKTTTTQSTTHCMSRALGVLCPFSLCVRGEPYHSAPATRRRSCVRSGHVSGYCAAADDGGDATGNGCMRGGAPSILYYCTSAATRPAGRRAEAQCWTRLSEASRHAVVSSRVLPAYHRPEPLLVPAHNNVY